MKVEHLQEAQVAMDCRLLCISRSHLGKCHLGDISQLIIK